MSCERYEKELALDVEGDLPASQVLVLEQHLVECERCRAFANGLKASQGALKALTEEPLPEATLAAVRTRVLAGIAGSPRPNWHTARAVWPVLAGAAVLLLAVAVFWLARSPLSAPQSRATAEVRPAATPQAPAALPGPQSTPRDAASVSQSVRPTKHARAPRLSPEDADQLARAVVVLSRLERLGFEGEAETDQPAVAPAPLTRIASDDPNVVIYWQFDSIGG